VRIPHQDFLEKQTREDEVIEKRYKSLFLGVDLTKDCFFSYTYNLAQSMQNNVRHPTAGTGVQKGDFRGGNAEMFVWNHFLLKEYQQVVDNPYWVVPIVHGFFSQVQFSVHGRQFWLSLISRRSRFFAGTRFLKRGITDLGHVANEVETEQMLHEELGGIYAPLKCTSFVQYRGSIPLFWCHTNTNIAKPPIKIYKMDPLHHAMRLHFADAEERYGSPIVIWNLIKKNEKAEHFREGLLGIEFEEACNFCNKDRSDDRRLIYDAIDFKQKSKEERSVLDYLEVKTRKIMETMGLFYGVSSKEDRTEVKPVTFQQGVLRSNCIDCLDRTNVAQFAAARTAFSFQLQALGLAEVHSLDYDSLIFQHLMDQYELMGNYLAQQYGGSQAHSGAFRKARGEWNVSRHSTKIMTDIRRYYSNTFTDADKQHAMNLFMGIFRPSRGQPHLWESEGDQNLHNEAEGGTLELLGEDHDGEATPAACYAPDASRMAEDQDLEGFDMDGDGGEVVDGEVLEGLLHEQEEARRGLSREELYELKHKPSILTSFDQHFSYPFNQPIAVHLVSKATEEASADNLAADEGKEASKETRIEAPDRATEEKCYAEYVVQDQRLHKGEVEIEDLAPGTSERKALEFQSYLNHQRVGSRKGRADTCTDDLYSAQDFYERAIQPTSATMSNLDAYTQLPEVALWQCLIQAEQDSPTPSLCPHL